MPLNPTATGFTVTYARGSSLVFGVTALIFSAAMLAFGSDVYWPVLDGTPFEDTQIERNPPWLWGGAAIGGGIVLSFVALWNALNAFGVRTAIELDRHGVSARTLIGRRSLQWEQIGHAAIVQGTLFIFPTPGSGVKPVPLQTFLTSVENDELINALTTRKPELFGTVEEI